MGLLTKIRDQPEQSSSNMLTSPPLPPLPQPSPPPAVAVPSRETSLDCDGPSPCKICHSPLFWESIYRDGNFRCVICEPAPTRGIVGRLMTLMTEPDGSFCFVPNDFANERAARIREATRLNEATHDSHLLGGATASAAALTSAESSAVVGTLPALAWSTPDAAGWCYAVDRDGRERARRAELLPTLPRLHARESEADLQARIENHRRIQFPWLQWIDESSEEWDERIRRMDVSVRAAEALAVSKM